MSGLTSAQRKLAYLVGILLLLVPIIYLGLPGAGAAVAAKPGAAVESGGRLAQLRQKYDLGESNLGEIDPSSVTMNLVLFGLRGLAANQLWIQMEQAKNDKDWSRMNNLTRSIVRLQPHYEKVWTFNGWNLAYNTSADWDAVADRYFWVKEGGKFLLDGIDRNKKSTELRFQSGTVYQKKIGIADEAAYYRKFFLADPDQTEAFFGRPDPRFNPDGKDSYLVAHDAFRAGVDNEVNFQVFQHNVDITIFHASPARCLFDYARGLQKDGVFGEKTRVAWADALDEWVNKYGAETFTAVFDQRPVKFKLEATSEDLRSLAASDNPEDIQRVGRAADAYQKINNYRYWRVRGQCEAEPETADAHRDFFEAGENYKKQNWREALTLVESAMKKYEAVLARYPELRFEDSMIEECMLAVNLWNDIYRLDKGEAPPVEYPLKTVWLENQGRMETVLREFKNRFLPK